MNWAPLLFMWVLSKRDSGAHHAPHWPTPKHPPPRHLRPVHHAAHHAAPAHHAAHHAPEHHAAPVHDVHHEAVHHSVHHEQPHVVHHAPVHHELTAPMIAPSSVPTGFESPFGPIAQAPVPVVAPAEHAATPLHELHAAPPEPPAAESTSGTSIAELQRILVGLGWRGHLITHGPVSPLLQDGEYGPVTHDDWVQSATKRHLDPTFVRLGPNTAQVDPGTYNALRAIAVQQGAVVGFGGARVLAGLYIP